MINKACRYYKASKPCRFNKLDGSECPSCRHVSEFKERILFVKLDAIGDVLRSASLLPTVVARHERPYLAWLTRRELAELVGMMKYVDEVIELSDVGMARVATGDWDFVYSLSNDMASASIASTAPARHTPIGFYARNGMIEASNAAAETWLEMGAFDRLKRENRELYQRRMLAILGADGGEIPPPALEIAPTLQRDVAGRIARLFPGSDRRRAAVNIGAGFRWPKKMLDVDAIVGFIRRLRARADVDVLLLGGAAEAAKAKAILAQCGSDERIQLALTETSIPEFTAVLASVDVLLCGDTLAMHIATAVGLPMVALFGPTSSAEIWDFDGLIAKEWTPELDCLVCYGDCAKERNCMSLLDLDRLVDLTLAQLSRPRPNPVQRAAGPG